MSDSSKCPACGAEIPSVSIKCEYCGFEVKNTNNDGLNLLQELQDKISDLNNSVSAKDKALYGEMQVWRSQAALINSFSLPTTKKDLIDLLLIAHSNIEGTAFVLGNPVKKAWSGKATQAYSMLKTYSEGDPQVMQLLEDYKSLDVKNKSKEKKGCLSQLSFLGLICFATYILFKG